MKGKETRHAHDDGPQHCIPDIEVVMGEAAPLVRQDAMVGILRRKFGHGDADDSALLHALEDEIDAIGIFLLHATQRGQNGRISFDRFMPTNISGPIITARFRPTLVDSDRAVKLAPTASPSSMARRARMLEGHPNTRGLRVAPSTPAAHPAGR